MVPLLSVVLPSLSAPLAGTLLRVMEASTSLSGSVKRLLKLLALKASCPSSARLALQLLTLGAVLPTRTVTERVAFTKMSGRGTLACVVSSGVARVTPLAPYSTTASRVAPLVREARATWLPS